MEEAAYYHDQEIAATADERHFLQLKKDVHPRIMEALDNFIDKVKDDRYIIAAILTSNLAEDNVWEHTNINLLLIGRDDAKIR